MLLEKGDVYVLEANSLYMDPRGNEYIDYAVRKPEMSELDGTTYKVLKVLHTDHSNQILRVAVLNSGHDHRVRIYVSIANGTVKKSFMSRWLKPAQRTELFQSIGLDSPNAGFFSKRI